MPLTLGKIGRTAVLALALAAGWLSYPLLLAYAVGMGVLQAFVNPARDALLSDVAGPDLKPNADEGQAQFISAIDAGWVRVLGWGLVVSTLFSIAQRRGWQATAR